MTTPWEALGARLVARWQRDELVELVAEPSGAPAALAEKLAEWLASRAGAPLSPRALGEWLLDQDEIDDVFGEDAALAAALEQEAHQVAAPASADPETLAQSMAQADAEVARAAARKLDAQIGPLLASFGRRDRRPQVRHEDGPATGSKYGGTPYLAPGEPWPCCENCEQPMPLLIQLDLASLPQGAHPQRQGMVQLFYCTSNEPLCEVDCHAWDPGAASTLVRWLLADEPAVAPAEDERAPPISHGHRPAQIMGWQQSEPELPAYGDSPDFIEQLSAQDIEWSDLAERKLTARVGDKLGGWPAWVQEPSYPRCPECRRAMRYLMQLESNGLCGHQFGDLGAGHLFQCDRHPGYVAFNWSGH